MHPNSGDHRGVPTFDQNLKSQLKHFLNAVAVATNLAQQTLDTVGCKSFGPKLRFCLEMVCFCEMAWPFIALLHMQLLYEVQVVTNGCGQHLCCSVLLGC